jgi:hypothetical protein
VSDADLTAGEVKAMLDQAGIDHSALTITDDPEVWVDIETVAGGSHTSVKIAGPQEQRQKAFGVLFAGGLGCMPNDEYDLWSGPGAAQ